jgi:hypothetical protein
MLTKGVLCNVGRRKGIALTIIAQLIFVDDTAQTLMSYICNPDAPNPKTRGM